MELELKKLTKEFQGFKAVDDITLTIRHALGPDVRVVSSAEETTRELEDILNRRDLLAPQTAQPEHRFATTSDNIAEFAAAGSFIFGQPLKSIEHISLDELRGL